MWSTFNRLFQTLRSNAVPTARRLQLWSSTCCTTMCYGLTSSGLPNEGVSLITSAVIKQVRLISKNPAHITREDNVSLWVRLQLKDLIQVLATALQTRLATAHDGDVVHMETATVQQW